MNQHPDDIAVDLFAAAMKEKLAAARAKGRGGWQDKTQCSALDLSRMLVEHVGKLDPVDVANFCMMLHQRGEGIHHVPDAFPMAAQILDDLRVVRTAMQHTVDIAEGADSYDAAQNVRSDMSILDYVINKLGYKEPQA